MFAGLAFFNQLVFAFACSIFTRGISRIAVFTAEALWPNNNNKLKRDKLLGTLNLKYN